MAELLELNDDQPSGRGLPIKIILIGVAAIILLAAIGVGVWYFLLRDHGSPNPKQDEAVESKEEEETPAENEPTSATPIFIALDPFIVNLQPSPVGKRMQIALTLQVTNEEQVEQFKLFMPEVRSRLLMLLSSKSGTEISTTEGKTALSNEIIEHLNQPFTGRKKQQHVTAVFFTSLVIQ